MKYTKLAEEWLLEADAADLQANEMEKKLITGKLYQEDQTLSTIHALHENAATLRSCASRLLAVSMSLG